MPQDSINNQNVSENQVDSLKEIVKTYNNMLSSKIKILLEAEEKDIADKIDMDKLNENIDDLEKQKEEYNKVKRKWFGELTFYKELENYLQKKVISLDKIYEKGYLEGVMSRSRNAYRREKKVDYCRVYRCANELNKLKEYLTQKNITIDNDFINNRRNELESFKEDYNWLKGTTHDLKKVAALYDKYMKGKSIYNRLDEVSASKVTLTHSEYNNLMEDAKEIENYIKNREAQKYETPNNISSSKEDLEPVKEDLEPVKEDLELVKEDLEPVKEYVIKFFADGRPKDISNKLNDLKVISDTRTLLNNTGTALLNGLLNNTGTTLLDGLLNNGNSQSTLLNQENRIGFSMPYFSNTEKGNTSMVKPIEKMPDKSILKMSGNDQQTSVNNQKTRKNVHFN